MPETNDSRGGGIPGRISAFNTLARGFGEAAKRYADGGLAAVSLRVAYRHAIERVGDAHPGSDTDPITVLQRPEAAAPQSVIVDIAIRKRRTRSGCRRGGEHHRASDRQSRGERHFRLAFRGVRRSNPKSLERSPGRVAAQSPVAAPSRGLERVKGIEASSSAWKAASLDSISKGCLENRS